MSLTNALEMKIHQMKMATKAIRLEGSLIIDLKIRGITVHSFLVFLQPRSENYVSI